MKSTHSLISHPLFAAALLGCTIVAVAGCRGHRGPGGPPYDRPFPLGQVTDSFWENQQTNSEAADFIFFDHEFSGDTAELAPAAKKKLMQVALRLEHVPFPVVVEESVHADRPALDAARRQTVVEQLARLGVENSAGRVIIARPFAEGITGVEAEQAYYSTLNSDFGTGGGVGRRFGGRGGFFR